MTAEERFERIEQKHEELAEFVRAIAQGHIDLETAQVNQTRVLTRFIDEARENSARTDEQIANLTILVDRLIARDLGSSL